jgi:hypothetical protein
MSVTLDWIAQHLPAPDLIKIDVEGAELSVLEHAGSLLQRGRRPCWILEVAAENGRAIADILRAYKYRLFDVDAPDHEVDTPVWNTLAVPADSL